jgi:hypothetical protein
MDYKINKKILCDYKMDWLRSTSDYFEKIKSNSDWVQPLLFDIKYMKRMGIFSNEKYLKDIGRIAQSLNLPISFLSLRIEGEERRNSLLSNSNKQFHRSDSFTQSLFPNQTLDFFKSDLKKIMHYALILEDGYKPILLEAKNFFQNVIMEKANSESPTSNSMEISKPNQSLKEYIDLTTSRTDALVTEPKDKRHQNEQNKNDHYTEQRSTVRHLN